MQIPHTRGRILCRPTRVSARHRRGPAGWRQRTADWGALSRLGLQCKKGGGGERHSLHESLPAVDGRFRQILQDSRRVGNTRPTSVTSRRVTSCRRTARSVQFTAVVVVQDRPSGLSVKRQPAIPLTVVATLLSDTLSSPPRATFPFR